MKSLLTLVAIAICAGTGWSVYQSSLVATQPVEKATDKTLPPVRIEPVRRQIVKDQIELVGSLEAQSVVEVRSAVPGYVVDLPFDLGDFVEAGAVVAELDSAEAREVVSRSEAALKVAEARVRSQQATVEHARSELQRWERLAKTGVSTGQQLEAARATMAVAEAQAELELAQVEQVKAELEQAKLQLEQTKIRAPASGYVAARLVSAGHLATPDLPLLRLVSIQIVRTLVQVPEQEYQRIREGQSASIGVEALPQQRFEGRIVRKAPVLDPATRTAAVEIEIPNSDQLLKPGMHARVQIVFDERSATVVPLAAVRESEHGRVVYTVSGEPPTAKLLKVETGVMDGDVIEIRKGLQNDDWVITLGHDQIGENEEVQPIRNDAQLAADGPRQSPMKQSDPG